MPWKRTNVPPLHQTVGYVSFVFSIVDADNKTRISWSNRVMKFFVSNLNEIPSFNRKHALICIVESASIEFRFAVVDRISSFFDSLLHRLGNSRYSEYSQRDFRDQYSKISNFSKSATKDRVKPPTCIIITRVCRTNRAR